MDYIAHRTQADDQQALDFWACFCWRRQDFLGDRRERMISLVE